MERRKKNARSSIDAEQAAIVLALRDIGLSLRARDDLFAYPSNRMIWRGLRALAQDMPPPSNRAVDPVVLIEWVRAHYDRDLSDYVADLMSAQIPNEPERFEHYLEILNGYAYDRHLSDLARDVHELAHSNAVPSEKASTLSRLVDKAIAGGMATDSFHGLGDALEEAIQDAIKSREAVSGLMTGFDEIDAITCGLLPGEVVVLAARPAMGKTSLAMNIAEYVASQGGGVAVFSLEMTASQLAMRMLSSAAGVDARKLRMGTLDALDISAIEAAKPTLQKLPILIDDSGKITADEIYIRLRQMERRIDKLRLVIIDYLGLIKGTTGRGRYEDVTEISGQIKEIAKRIGVPVILLAQLSREVEKRADKRPLLSDLRDSGAIEQDADIVMFVYRDDYYHKDSPYPGKAEVIVAKHRSGCIGVAMLDFESRCTRFRNCSAPLDNEIAVMIPSL